MTNEEFTEQATRALWAGFIMGARAVKDISDACVRVAETRMEDMILAGIERGYQSLTDEMARELLPPDDDEGADVGNAG